jgi:DNA-binding beta-propeller fold protein YncE
MAIAKATYVQVACEPATDTIYVTNAGWGIAIALDPTAGTACVPNNDDDTVSMFAFWRRGPVDAACRS